MIICHCKVVTDREIRQAVRSGATTVGQINRRSRAGTCCGGCVGALVEILEETRNFEEYQKLPIAAE